MVLVGALKLIRRFEVVGPHPARWSMIVFCTAGRDQNFALYEMVRLATCSARATLDWVGLFEA